MKAAVYDAPGVPDVLRYAEVADPEPRSHEILMRVEAISVEGGDVLRRASVAPPGPAHVVGFASAGTVVAVGAKVSTLIVGDRVTALAAAGSHAALRAVPAEACWPIPGGLDSVSAACAPGSFGTAQASLIDAGGLRSGETALVHSGSSGVGVAAIQLGLRAGARVLATASTAEKAARLSEIGASTTIDYGTTDLVSAVRRATGDQGVDVVLDLVGGAGLQRSIACLARRGRCVTAGDGSRESTPTTIDVSTLRFGNQRVIGCALVAELAADQKAYKAITEHLRLLSTGALRVVVDRLFPLADAAGAHAYIESRQSVGRVVLVP